MLVFLLTSLDDLFVIFVDLFIVELAVVVKHHMLQVHQNFEGCAGNVVCRNLISLSGIWHFDFVVQKEQQKLNYFSVFELKASILAVQVVLNKAQDSTGQLIVSD